MKTKNIKWLVESREVPALRRVLAGRVVDDDRQGPIVKMDEVILDVPERIADSLIAQELAEEADANVVAAIHAAREEAAGGAVVAPPASEEPAGDGVSVPFMITRAVRSRLQKRGYADDVIDKMTPEEAHNALQ